MRLVSAKYGIDMEIRENMVNVLVVEAPDIFSRVIEELMCQIEGEPGTFILSEQDVIKTISKNADMIVNPFRVDCNEKRIQQKLFQELSVIMNESFGERTVYLQGQIISYLEELLQKVPYPLDFDVEGSMPGLLKMCHVEVVNQGDTLVEKIVNYMKALRQFCAIKVIFAVNLKLYLTLTELIELYKFVFYEKISLILLEHSDKGKLEGESICILDKDMCIINVK